MKLKIKPGLICAVSAVLLWSSCDKIEEPLNIVSEQLSTDGLLDTLYFMDSADVKTKQVLLEDFTGHKCVNCPEAAIAAHDLAETLNHKLIIYSVHAGYYAEPDPTGHYTADFRCETGEALYNDFTAFANPIGLINRVVYNGSRLIGAGSWETVVMQELAKPNRVDLKVKTIWYPNLEKVQLHIYTTFLQAETDSVKLVVYLAEDNIISPQMNNNPSVGPTPDWLDYEHHNILRTSLNSTYGERLTENGIVDPNTEYHTTFIFEPDTAWELSNCRIIAYIIEEGSKEVLQVAEAGIKVTE